jgi:hypothetical protein
MPTCSQCGKEVSFWGRDILTRACPRCRAVGARPGTLGCGTLLLVGLIVAIFSRPGLDELQSRVSELRSEIQELKKASEAQTGEIRELRKAIDELRKGTPGLGK